MCCVFLVSSLSSLGMHNCYLLFCFAQWATSETQKSNKKLNPEIFGG